jgi:hypothetical protein
MSDTNELAAEAVANIERFKMGLEQVLRDIGAYLGHDRCIEILSRERTRVLCEQIVAERERKGG